MFAPGRTIDVVECDGGWICTVCAKPVNFVPPPTPAPPQVPAVSAAEKAMTQKEADTRLAVAKTKSAVILMEAIAEDVEQRKKDGTLAKDFSGAKLTSLINSFTKIVTAFKQTGIVIVPQGGGQPAAKDPSWFRANSPTNMTDAERERMRREARDAEVVPEQENP